MLEPITHTHITIPYEPTKPVTRQCGCGVQLMYGQQATDDDRLWSVIVKPGADWSSPWCAVVIAPNAEYAEGRADHAFLDSVEAKMLTEDEFFEELDARTFDVRPLHLDVLGLPYMIDEAGTALYVSPCCGVPVRSDQTEEAWCSLCSNPLDDRTAGKPLAV